MTSLVEIFIVTQAIMMPIAWAFSKAQLKSGVTFDVVKIENLFHGDAECGSKCEPIHDTLSSGCISVGDNYKQANRRKSCGIHCNRPTENK